MKNPNAHAALVTNVFVWAIAALVAHYHLAEITPNRIIVAAAACTTVILWVGREGIAGAAHRVWYGAKAVYTGGTKSASKPAAKS
jgi:hypothetical protein